MCDYSLHAVASRPAKIGDQLTTTTFPNTVTRGFCALEERHVAVCLLPGTEIAFEKEAESSTSLCEASAQLRFWKTGRRRRSFPTNQHPRTPYAPRCA